MFLGSAGAAVFLGLADYLASLLGSLGMKGLFSEWLGCICMFLIYHGFMLILWCRDPEGESSYFSVKTSMYYEVVESTEVDQVKPENEEPEYRFSYRRLWGMITRIIFQLGIQICLI